MCESSMRLICTRCGFVEPLELAVQVYLSDFIPIKCPRCDEPLVLES